jgi:uncharacterized membrane protein (DUF2068 family)
VLDRIERNNATTIPAQFSMPAQKSGDGWMVLIAVFKLTKGVLLAAAAIGGLRLLHKDVAAVAEHWIDVLRVDPDNRYVQALVVKLVAVNDRRLKELSVGTFFYAALFLTEGTGLLLRKRWAQYFTLIVTASFIPLEVYELVVHASIVKAVLIFLNLAIIGYLIVRLRHESRMHSSGMDSN